MICQQFTTPVDQMIGAPGAYFMQAYIFNDSISATEWPARLKCYKAFPNIAGGRFFISTVHKM